MSAHTSTAPPLVNHHVLADWRLWLDPVNELVDVVGRKRGGLSHPAWPLLLDDNVRVVLAVLLNGDRPNVVIRDVSDLAIFHRVICVPNL